MTKYDTFVIPADTIKPLIDALNGLLDQDTLHDETIVTKVADFLVSKESIDVFNVSSDSDASHNNAEIEEVADFLVSKKSDVNKPADLFIASILTDVIYDDYKSDSLNIALDVSRCQVLGALKAYDNRFVMGMIDRIKTVNHVVIVQTRKENLC
jgi:hypothetical protein